MIYLAGTDFSHLTDDELLNGIKSLNIPDYIRSKSYGIDVRETLAQMTEMLIQLAYNQGLNPQQAQEFVYRINNKINKGDVSMSDLTQEVKEALTGGAVAVVGESSVNTTNIVDDAVTVKKLANGVRNDLGYYNSSWVDGKFIATNGTIGNGEMYAYTDLIYLPQDEVVEITAGGSASVSVISSYDSSGNFLRNVQTGQDKVATYTLRAMGAGMWIRVTNNRAWLSHGESYVKSIVKVKDNTITENKLTEKVQKEIGYVPYQLVHGEFITSGSHPLGAGKVGYGPTYFRTEPIYLQTGQEIEYVAISSSSTLSLAIVDSNGTFEDVGIVGSDNASPIKYFKAHSNCYVVITNNTANVPLSDFYVKYKENKGIFITPQLLRKATINFQLDDGLEIHHSIKAIFDEFGLRCGFALPTNANKLDAFLPYQNQGFEIISHSIDGGDFNNSGISVSDAETKMKQSKVTLENIGFEVHGWVTPSSLMKDQYIPSLKKYYEYGYTQYLGAYEGSGAPYDTFGTDTRYLKRVSLETSTIENVKKAIDETIANNGFLSFYAHDLSRGLTEAGLREVLTYVKAKQDIGDAVVGTPYETYVNYFSLRHDDYLSLINQ